MTLNINRRISRVLKKSLQNALFFIGKVQLLSKKSNLFILQLHDTKNRIIKRW